MRRLRTTQPPALGETEADWPCVPLGAHGPAPQLGTRAAGVTASFPWRRLLSPHPRCLQGTGAQKRMAMESCPPPRQQMQPPTCPRPPRPLGKAALGWMPPYRERERQRGDGEGLRALGRGSDRVVCVGGHVCIWICVPRCVSAMCPYVHV